MVFIGPMLLILKVITNVCTFLTLPIYIIVGHPLNRWRRSSECFARRVERDTRAPYWRSAKDFDVFSGVATLDELARQAIEKWPLQRCLGSRPILYRGQHVEVESGKIVKTSRLGEYRWMTFYEAHRKIESISRGLMLSGVRQSPYLAILAETSQEWFLTAQACIRQNIPLVTLNTSLSDYGIVYAMNETKATHLVTSNDVLPRVRRLVDKTPWLKYIVYIDTTESWLEASEDEEPKVIPFSSFESLCVDAVDYECAPTPDDVAVVTYTSGPRGVPRGVVATHKNIIAAINGLCAVRRAYCSEDDLYIAYLPLAHMFELVAELLAFGTGTPIGYSSALTMTDSSAGLAEGCSGDVTLLQPTQMAAVPIIVDRVCKEISDAVASKGLLLEAFLHYAVDYKISWQDCGFETPLLDVFIFNKLRRVLGSRLRVLVCGSAPLSTRTRRFAQACLCCHVIEAYGTTETCAVATANDINDKSVGRVGAAVPGTYVRLVDWPEGSCYVTDRPNPRGEIVVGGPCVAQGYFSRKLITSTAFRYEAGVRWFFTGDIGEIYPDGTLKIIDRKKLRLVNLQCGESAWLDHVEAVLRMCPLVDNVLVYGSQKHAYLVALVAPNHSQLHNLALGIGRSRGGWLPLKKLCEDVAVSEAATELIRAFARESGKLQKSEVPQKVKLCCDEWGSDTGLVTASLRICRKPLEEFYKSDIRALYGETEMSGATQP